MKKKIIFHLKYLVVLILVSNSLINCRLIVNEPNKITDHSPVLIKAEITDIEKVAPSGTIFLKDEEVKFPEEIPEILKGLEFTKTLKGTNSVKEAFIHPKNTLYIALNESEYKSKDWINLNKSINIKSQVLYIYRSNFNKSNSWIDIPQLKENGTILFSNQLELVNTSPPGTVITQSSNPKLNFITDPTIAILPNGKYIAGCKSKFDGKNSSFRIFESTNKGKSWKRIADLSEVGFCNLFYYQKALYIMGTKGGFNHAIILKSEDEGKTWTTPINSKSGLLMGQSKSYHSAPVPVVVSNGRIWRAMEDNIPLGGRNFRAFVMSAPINSNLLDSTSWTSSNPLPYKEEWLTGGRTFNGWLEGNAVVSPDGSVVDIIRIEERTYDGKAAMIHISKDGKKSTFDPKKDLIDFPGGSKKFDIRYDSISKKYWSITNHTFAQDLGKVHCGLTRNRVVLTFSTDLRNWVIKDTLISNNDPYYHGYQYISWQFDKNDIVAVSRTAHDYRKGLPRRQHDANYFTFHRFQNFRN